MGSNGKRAGILFGIVSGISYGFYGIFSSMLLEAGVTDLSVVVLPALALTVFFGIKVLFKPRVLKEIPWKYVVVMLLQGFFISNGMNYCYASAYGAGMPVGVVSIVAFCNVIVVMILSYFVFKYKFTLSKVIAIIMALGGVSLVIGIFNGGVGVFTASGLMWTALIPIFYGVNVVMNTYFIVKECDTDAILLITQGGALVFMLIFMVHPVALVENIFGSIGGNPLYWAAFLGFCLIPHALTYGTMQEALKRIEPTIYQILMALDPVTALILGIIAFGQSVSILQIVGVAIVLASVLYINIVEGKEAAAENAGDNT